ncbi:TPA: hypothetical protein ACPZG9_000271 [Yersinia enterocolitica]
MSEPNNELKTTVERKYVNGKPQAVSIKTSGTLSNGESFFASSFHYDHPEVIGDLLNIMATPEYTAARNSHDALFRKSVEETFPCSNENIERKNATTIDSITIYTPTGSTDSVEP